jgi:hypothetical protein
VARHRFVIALNRLKRFTKAEPGHRTPRSFALLDCIYQGSDRVDADANFIAGLKREIISRGRCQFQSKENNLAGNELSR